MSVNVAHASLFKDAMETFPAPQVSQASFPKCSLCSQSEGEALHALGDQSLPPISKPKWIVNLNDTYIHVMPLSLLAVLCVLSISLYLHWIITALVQIMAVSSRRGTVSIRKYRPRISCIAPFSAGSQNLLLFFFSSVVFAQELALKQWLKINLSP